MRFPKRYARVAFYLAASLLLLPAVAMINYAAADEAIPAPEQIPKVSVTIPHAAVRYQRDLTRNARLAWGLNAPVAVFAAQIQQESRWRSDAVSAVGAKGMAQFMPRTAAWITQAYHLGDNAPTNPVWALRALTLYDKYLWDRVEADDDCSHMAMALSGYNGGLGWVYRDQKAAREGGGDEGRWFGQVERFNAGRIAASFAENRGYPRIILLRWAPVYSSWGGTLTC